MSLPQRLGDLLAEHASRSFVGRGEELVLLEGLVGPAGEASVVHVHGDAGIGKSALVGAFLDRLRGRCAATVKLDCRSIEPTERGLLEALAIATRSDEQGVDAIIARLGSISGTVVVTLDHFEVFRLMDTWLRQVLVPALDEHVRVLLVGREAPVAAWFGAGWEGLFRSVALGPLVDDEAELLLTGRGHSPDEARRLNRIARGHPLALTLASAAARERPDLVLEEAATTRVVTELTRMYLEDVPDPLTRRALEAASVIRRVTQPLLDAMLAEAASQDAFDRLLTLPFVDLGSDGVLLHDAVREPISSFLRSTDPSRHRDYRRAAWRRLRSEVRHAAAPELWRYTADMLYLIANPVVREAFFPSGAQPLAVEPAGPGDEAAIFAIAARHDGPDAVAQLEGWWAYAPHTFSAIRDRDGTVRAFFVLVDSATILPPDPMGDPVVGAWRQHLRDHPLLRGQLALGLRRWLDIDCGEGPGPAQAACWLDAKRTYMAMRPALRRMYVTVNDAATYLPVVEKLGFRPLPVPIGPRGREDAGSAAPAALDGRHYASVVLDFGPGSVDGWLARLVAAELGLDDDCPLDDSARELTVGGRLVALTPLEFGVLRHLDAAAGRTVSRPELLSEVWGYQFAGGSNVVDAAVRSLRHKLGDAAMVVETVRGAGYRVPEEWRALVA
jgi:Transcriptional regulatory protein, C terminal/AAA ATPase domain